jgi:hypothetical protein
MAQLLFSVPGRVKERVRVGYFQIEEIRKKLDNLGLGWFGVVQKPESPRHAERNEHI